MIQLDKKRLTRPLLLDLFCGAGGCTKGYQRAGFYVIGIDDFRQGNYCGDEFILGDAYELWAKYAPDVDAIHASPPCQFYTNATSEFERSFYSDSITPTRDLLMESGKPYVIENVLGARPYLVDPFMLCGTMFGLGVRRHRLFESTVPMRPTAKCSHTQPAVIINGSSKKHKDASADEMRAAMGIEWMTRDELQQAIPPAYSEWIGIQLMKTL